MKKNNSKDKLTVVEMGTTVALLLSKIHKGLELKDFTTKQIEFFNKNPNHITSETTLLNYAIGCKNDCIASYLLEHGANVNLSSKCIYVTDTYSVTPIGWAARIGNTEMFEKLLKAGAKWNFDNKKINLLNIITQTQDVELIFEKLIDHVLKNENEQFEFLQMLYNKESQDLKPIQYIVRSKNEVLLKILEKNADKFKINEPIFLDSEQMTYVCNANEEIKKLMCSISEKGIFVVEYKGEKQKLDMNSLTQMTEEVNKEIFLKKLRELVDKTKITEKDEGLVHSICKYLAKEPELIEIIENTITKKRFDKLEIMLKAIDGLEIGNKSTFLILLFKPQNEKLLEFFVQKAPVNTVDSNARTALHLACLFKKTEIVKMLLLRKPDINKKDNNQKMALDYAKNNEEIQGLLTYFQINQKLLIEKLKKEQQELKDKQLEISINEEKKQLELKALEKLELLKQEVEKEKTTSNKNDEFEKAYQELSNPENEKSLGEYFNCAFNLIEDYKKFVEEKEKNIQIEEDKNNCNSWVVDGITYSTDANVLYHYEYHNQQYYFVLGGKLEELSKPQVNALEKGFVTSSKGQSGIKLLDKKSLIEIKVVQEDCRIYAEEGYINSKGSILIIFNKKGNHETIKNAAKEGKLLLEPEGQISLDKLIFGPEDSTSSNGKEEVPFSGHNNDQEN